MEETNIEIKEFWECFEVPDFLIKYQTVPCIKRLKGISYFCGMDYASKYYYSIKYFVSRYDHSMTCALLTWHLTHDKKLTIAALLHDVGTPCFSHTIDYMNHDYKDQESTESRTIEIIENDSLLKQFLKDDNITIENIKNSLKNTVVDNKRPDLCVDRLDGIITPSLAWLKNIDITMAKKIALDAYVAKNASGVDTIRFHSLITAYIVNELNKEINIATHSKHDVYLMMLLANITSNLIDKGYIKYDDLYHLKENELCNIINNIAFTDRTICEMWTEFKETTYIPDQLQPEIKVRAINFPFKKPIAKNDK